MNSTSLTAAAALALAAVLVTGCSRADGGPATTPTAAAPSTTRAASTGATARDAMSSSAAPTAATVARELPQGADPVDLDPADFRADIDHPYWPMAPGTQWTYREVEGEDVLDVVVTVTDQTREVANGITARVVRDTVSRDGVLVEDTFDWYAQDGAGNVWYLGEDTAEFEDGAISTRAGSFEAGVDGALPGILLPADPAPGMAYRQEYYEGEAEDNAAVLSTDEMAEVPHGQFTDVLLTRDTITIEPTVLEYKLFAPGVGPVLTLDVSGGSGRSELVDVGQVPPGTATGPLGDPDGMSG